MQLRMTTFNLENLYSRYSALDARAAGGDLAVQMTGVTSIDWKGAPLDRATTLLQRNNTARAILDCRPDVLAVQEVENLWTLRCFNDEFLGGTFDRLILLEGNDGRGIDVGLCLRFGCAAQVSAIRTHVDDALPGRERVNRFYSESRDALEVDGNLFSRDCLEVDVDAGKARLTFLVNHFKAQDSSKASNALRKAQAARVAQLVAEVKSRQRQPVVCGDLNEDWVSPAGDLAPLKDRVGKELADPFASEDGVWTHFYEATGETSRLDYILVDSGLSTSAPSILSKGISLKCSAAGERYPTVGYSGTEASDHCPVSVVLELAD